MSACIGISSGRPENEAARGGGSNTAPGLTATASKEAIMAYRADSAPGRSPSTDNMSASSAADKAGDRE